jgi:YHS domain-containing protein
VRYSAFLVLLTLALAAIGPTGGRADAASSTPTTPKPADCVLPGAEGAAASTEFGGKTYYFTNEACKDEFLTDPERYSQLYDALLELKAQGSAFPKPKPRDDASLVPS